MRRFIVMIDMASLFTYRFIPYNYSAEQRLSGKVLGQQKNPHPFGWGFFSNSSEFHCIEYD